MPDRLPDDPTKARNGVKPADATRRNPAASGATPPVRGFLFAFLGTLAALAIFGILGLAIYFGYNALKSTPATSSTLVAANKSAPSEKNKNPFNDPATWVLGEDPAQNLSGDGTADIGWWARTFDLPDQGKVMDYLKAQGLTVSRIVPLHYDDTKDATTITYQVDATVPASLYRVPKATWAPGNPELRPFASLVVLNHDLPAGQFWNTQGQIVAQEAGTKLDFAWKVKLDKSANTVTTDRVSNEEGVFTQQQVAQLQAETENTVAQLQGQVQGIDARVQSDMQAKLAQVPSDPPRPQLRSTQWNSGDGSGEPTRSAERIGGGAAAGAAGGAAFGAAAGNAGEGAGIGAGVGLLGGIIYDAVSKNNDRERYRRAVAAENAEKLSDWRAQLKSLAQQRAQIQQDGVTEKQQAMQDLANAITAANGHLDSLSGQINPEPTTTSDAPPAQLSADQPSGAMTSPAPTSDQPSGANNSGPQSASSPDPGADQPSGPIGASSGASTGSASGSSGLTVDLVVPPGAQHPNYGDVRLTLANGQTEMLTHDGKAFKPAVSSTGLVGWGYVTGIPPKPDYVGNQDVLAVRLPDGSVKKFKPNDRFIEKWGFADDDSSVIMADMNYHGPMSFIKYDVRSGRVLGAIQGYVEHDKLPEWAKSYDDL
jgi:hypothetical protein